ncbi:hypothetical protein EV13_0883 [Prochlorococcus sp. MIT 0702]|nr:hypothetical protein EV12_0496 [Prochlorococcus sp. MIT 0701]KGG29666.1 hypothetical protein EV13_0883 [Prochlorococcus sp. MIT 0702]KGG34220.1 hypothetical protein EV14_1314 [Prochlorococcus sp. MIT 0703]
MNWLLWLMSWATSLKDCCCCSTSWASSNNSLIWRLRGNQLARASSAGFGVTMANKGGC